MQRLASIDIGSNTLRLLIAEWPAPGPLRPTQVERRITRLGERFLPSRTLQSQAMARSVAALKEFARLMDEKGVRRYLAGATAVVREASNGEQFLRMVQQEAGLSVRLLSGSEEARLALHGAGSVVSVSGVPLALFDIGGGSTELIWRTSGEGDKVESVSLPVGVVHLTETFLKEDPPGPDASTRLARHVRSVLEGVDFPAHMNDTLWVGTAGTLTTLASMRLEMRQYDPERINGMILEKVWLVDLCERLAHMPVAQRRELVGLEPGREDIILAGALVTLEFMSTFAFSSVTVSDAGLLEGLFLDLCGCLSSASEDTGGRGGAPYDVISGVEQGGAG